jgi:CHAD domain-containing protein
MNKPVACHRSDNPERSKIELDSLTVKKLALLAEKTVQNLQPVRDCDVLLSSLNNYLEELSNPEEARKSSLLLRAYTDVVPEWLQEVEDWVTEIHEALSFILAANSLGVASGSYDDE